MREFTTAVKQAHDPETQEEEVKGSLVKIDGRECTYHRPQGGQLAMFMSGVGRYASAWDRIAAVTDMFLGCFTKDDREWLASRLLDPDDEFGAEQMEEILEAMIEEWSGRPTDAASASGGSQRNGGKNSKRRSQQST